MKAIMKKKPTSDKNARKTTKNVKTANFTKDKGHNDETAAKATSNTIDSFVAHVSQTNEHLVRLLFVFLLNNVCPH